MKTGKGRSAVLKCQNDNIYKDVSIITSLLGHQSPEKPSQKNGNSFQYFRSSPLERSSRNLSKDTLCDNVLGHSNENINSLLQ